MSDLAARLKRRPPPNLDSGGANPPPPKRRSTWADLEGILGPIEWHWQGWLAPGFFHLLAGQTGAGKSALALRVAACYLKAWPWPSGAAYAGQASKVLWLECESAQALNLQRAKDWGLPLENLICPLKNPLDTLDWRRHQKAILEAASLDGVGLIVLDSLSGANGGRLDENSQTMLQLGSWLAKLAQQTGKPVLATHHTRKRGLRDTGAPSLDRVRGSGTIPQLSRVVWMLDCPKPSDPQSLRLSVVKSNLAKLPKPIGMSFDPDGLPMFGDAPQQQEAKTETEQAQDWLLGFLSNGPAKASHVLLAAEVDDISERTLKRAKTALGVQSSKQGAVWQWSLPQ